MEDNKAEVVACLMIATLVDSSDEEESAGRGKTRKWIKRRATRGYFNTIIDELRCEDTNTYKEMMRMSYETFKEILRYIEPQITPEESFHGTEPIRAEERLALTIRFLATGETFRSLHYQFRISERAISYIVSQVCGAIVDKLGEKYIVLPKTEEEWLQVSELFETRWQFPHCIGAIDGKHIMIQPPVGSGSEFYNYKKNFSIILLAIAGPDYECLYADIGCRGRSNDSGVWNASELYSLFEDGMMGLPSPRPLPHGVEEVPYTIVGDDAFALKPYMMKPYSQKELTTRKRVYNYRHSRARRISENLFGIIANRWRIFLSQLRVNNDKAVVITHCALVLHNFLRKSSSRNVYCPSTLADHEDAEGRVVLGSWRSDVASAFAPLNASAERNRNPTRNAKEIRDTFADYFMNEGSVSWQWENVL